MPDFLTNSQIEYILYHLSFFIDLSELKKFFVFSPNTDPLCEEKKIQFILSNKQLNQQHILFIESIPVLFPLKDTNKPFDLIGENLVFHHDILKSAFYLLSGMQEFESGRKDKMGRFPFKGSLHEKLGITDRPVVNYYFQWILEGLKEFCYLHNIPFQLKQPFQQPVFILSHDIDRIRKYDFYETTHKLLEFLGLKPSTLSRRSLYKVIPKYIREYLFGSKQNDPFWNFEKLRSIEKELGIYSTWYFLEKQGRHVNSRYYFTDKNINKLLQFLVDEKCEIGLHGTVKSADDLDAMQTTLTNLKNNTNSQISGIRQHKLVFSIPNTLLIQQEAGLEYDHTLTFAEHEGFRNSFCFPYRPYDFEKGQIMDLWEIPLIAMDGTLFYYRKLTFSEIEKQIDLLLSEIKKFGGIFSLLWHNSHFDEDEFPGISDFYIKLLKNITDSGFIPMTAEKVTKMVKSL